MNMKLYTIRTLSGLHCGIGQGLSDIDLPTARESVTGHPLIPGSSVKGVLRDHFHAISGSDEKKFLAAFGQDSAAGNLEFASALSFSDSRLVCLPVRSRFGTFAWLTSPTCLRRVGEQLARSGIEQLPELPEYPVETNVYRASLPEGSRLVRPVLQGQVLLEDLNLLVDEKSAGLAREWADLLGRLFYPGNSTRAEEGRKLFWQRFVIADDDVLSFLCETALPVAARICIGENGTVKKGALWYEEYVPAESLFLGAVVATDGYGENKGYTADDLLGMVTVAPLSLQIGGNATIGRGFVEMNFNEMSGGRG